MAGARAKPIPGAKGQRQPFQSGDAANQGQIIQALRLQAAPGVRASRSLRTGGNSSQAVAQLPC